MWHLGKLFTDSQFFLKIYLLNCFPKLRRMVGYLITCAAIEDFFHIVGSCCGELGSFAAVDIHLKKVAINIYIFLLEK